MGRRRAALLRSILVVSVSPDLVDLFTPLMRIPTWVHQVIRPVWLEGNNSSAPVCSSGSWHWKPAGGERSRQTQNAQHDTHPHPHECG